jgi:hypothetical protein
MTITSSFILSTIPNTYRRTDSMIQIYCSTRTGFHRTRLYIVKTCEQYKHGEKQCSKQQSNFPIHHAEHYYLLNALYGSLIKKDLIFGNVLSPSLRCLYVHLTWLMLSLQFDDARHTICIVLFTKHGTTGWVYKARVSRGPKGSYSIGRRRCIVIVFITVAPS